MPPVPPELIGKTFETFATQGIIGLLLLMAIAGWVATVWWLVRRLEKAQGICDAADERHRKAVEDFAEKIRVLQAEFEQKLTRQFETRIEQGQNTVAALNLATKINEKLAEQQAQRVEILDRCAASLDMLSREFRANVQAGDARNGQWQHTIGAMIATIDKILDRIEKLPGDIVARLREVWK